MLSSQACEWSQYLRHNSSPRFVPAEAPVRLFMCRLWRTIAYPVSQITQLLSAVGSRLVHHTLTYSLAVSRHLKSFPGSSHRLRHSTLVSLVTIPSTIFQHSGRWEEKTPIFAGRSSAKSPALPGPRLTPDNPTFNPTGISDHGPSSYPCLWVTVALRQRTRLACRSGGRSISKQENITLQKFLFLFFLLLLDLDAQAHLPTISTTLQASYCVAKR